MGDFSRSPQANLRASLEKGYVGLHVEQGAPLLDRDLNLMQDLVMACVRSLAARFIGDGVPAGSGGFEIQAVPAAGDFRVLAGSPAPGVCLVGGVEARIQKDVVYSEQVPKPPALTTPAPGQGETREDTVYLDVSITTVDGSTDRDLLNDADIGMQTSVRLAPGWTVRVAENATTPPADVPPGHAFFPLARLHRKADVAEIRAEMIEDLRQTSLTLGDVERRLSFMARLLMTPAFVPPPDDQIRPKVGGVGAGTVTLRGRNFAIDPENVQVLFGKVRATVVRVTPTEIETRVPAGISGKMRLTIITPGGSIVSEEFFTVIGGGPAPSFDDLEFSPNTGGAGTEVSLLGENFDLDPPDRITVLFGTQRAEVLEVSTGEIRVLVPEGVTGPVKITVTTSGGTATSGSDFAAGAAPAFTSVGDQFMPRVGGVGQKVTLFGANFNVPPVSVRFGSLPAPPVGISDSQITTVVPAGVAGALRIQVVTGVGSVVSDQSYTVL